MWSIEQESCQPWSSAPLAPSEILYEFDGPLTFTAQFGFFSAIFHKIGQRRGSHFYLAVETSGEIIDALKLGRISVRGALNRRHVWVLETDDNLQVKRYWSSPHDEIPEMILPHRGVSLFSYLGSSPDSIEQANSFFSFAFVGAELKKESVPFSLFKNLIDKSYEAARRFLSPVFLIGARSATFDFPAKTIPGSLILTLDDPLINSGNLRKRTLRDPVSIEDAYDYFSAQREIFFDEVEELVEQAEVGQVSDALAEERFSLLDNLQYIIPSDENRIDRVEFAGKSGSGVRSVVVDERSGDTIQRAFRRVESKPISETGRIEIVNTRSQYFVYRSMRGKQVSCHIPPEMFARLEADGLMRNGALVKVRGYLSRRQKRDEMRTNIEPEIIMPKLPSIG